MKSFKALLLLGVVSVLISKFVTSTASPASSQDATVNAGLISQMASKTDWCETERRNSCETAQFAQWHGDMRYRIISEKNDNRVDAVQEAIDAFKLVLETSTSINLVANDDANVFIWLGSEEIDIVMSQNPLAAPSERVLRSIAEPNASGLPCGGTVIVDGNEILIAAIYIGAGTGSTDASSCVQEELYNSMGLYSDPYFLPSLFDWPLDGYPSVIGKFGAAHIEILRIFYRSSGNDVDSIRNAMQSQ
ncbi:hypothetical protein QTO30_15620 [Yoonia sp. GPGPB17]|uniref:hypothetical protein n=1 Tax=Yoonia sp. GPGPB17 TaxID=3026147 RepID=UPI0030C5E631